MNIFFFHRIEKSRLRPQCGRNSADNFIDFCLIVTALRSQLSWYQYRMLIAIELGKIRDVLYLAEGGAVYG